MATTLSAAEALASVQSNQHLFIHSGVSTPQRLIQALVARATELENVHIYQIHTEGDASYAEARYSKNFVLHNFFNGSNMRKQNPRITECYVPMFLSEIPSLFYNKHVQLDVALIQVSPPDAHGMCSLGASVDISISAVRTAKTIIAQVNPQVPRTFGDGQISFSAINYAVFVDEPLHTVPSETLPPREQAIGKHVASLVEDGATLQLGIGSIPNAVMQNLSSHQNLGLHTEMFSDGVIDLFQNGVITGCYKKKHPGKLVSSFVIGSKRLYDFVNDNPSVLLLDCAYTNNVTVIAQNPKVTAINSAIEIDLTGQVCADSIGSHIYSGIGGQMDFIRGAALSPGGKPIIALPATTKNGDSKIVPFLHQGAGVTTSRAHVHYVVTEYGVAYLYGKTLAERVKALLEIAAPQHRETLEREWRQSL